MSRFWGNFWRFTTTAIAIVPLCGTVAEAEDVSASKILIKDNADPAKRQAQVQSKDAGVALAEAGDPSVHGAAIHLYSATDDFCVILPGGAEWTSKPKLWKYKNKATKNTAQIGDGKLKVKIKSGVSYTLADDGVQGIVTAQVQFATGTRYCMQCPGNKKDDMKKFVAKNCVATPCDPEPSGCSAVVTTTTTSTTNTTTSLPPGAIFQGALAPTNGRFNFNLTIGVPGADDACDTEWPGSHACLLSELQTAEGAGELAGATDIGGGTVTSFWAIDAGQPDVDQCGQIVPWDYATAHLGQFGDRVNLTNATGVLSAVIPDQLCIGSSWVGCCR